jgi:uncharacterized protein (DUF2141 family)
MAKLILTGLLLGYSLSSLAQTGTVRLHVQGIQTAKGGEISAGIFRQENFPKPGRQYMGTERAIDADQMHLIFEDVPEGEYALVAFQDIDRNKDLKTNFLGYPTEPIGFSNDVRIKLGPPAFDEAKVRVEAGKTLSVTITLR